MIPSAIVTATVTTPYVNNHAIGRVWIAVAVLAGVIEISGAFRRRANATRRDRGSQVVLRICLIPAVVFLAESQRIAPGAQIRPPFVAAVVGIGLFCAGEAMRIWAKVALGRYFTYTVMTSSDQPVITSGPYRLLRHPSYTGILLMAIGAATVYGNWLGLGVFVIMTTIGLGYRIHVEEHALLDELGDRYRAYAEHHKRLIPFVW